MIPSWVARTSTALLFITALSLLVGSCKKTGDQFVGKDLLPAGDNLLFATTDTFDVLMYTMRDDSVRSDERALNPIGFINDPYLGKSNSAVYAQLRLSENNLSFSQVHIDSVVLRLQYAGKNSYYGNLSSPQRIKVYEVAQQLFLDSFYYSNSTIAINPEPIGESINDTYYNLTDSVTVGSGSRMKRLPPHLAIRINPFSAFVTKLKFGDAKYASNDEFVKYINGICLKVEDNGLAPGEGSMVNLNLLAPNMGLVIYYNDSLSKTLVINDNSPRLNVNAFDYSNTPLQNQLGSKTHRDTTYVQSLGGVHTYLRFPTLANLVKASGNKSIAILDAHISIPVLPGSYTSGSFGLPTQKLLAVKTDSMLKSRFDGGVVTHEFSTGNATIEFNMNQYYIQQYLNEYKQNGKPTYPSLFISNYYTGMERIVLSTNKALALRPKLIITYTVVQ